MSVLGETAVQIELATPASLPHSATGLPSTDIYEEGKAGLFRKTEGYLYKSQHMC